MDVGKFGREIINKHKQFLLKSKQIKTEYPEKYKKYSIPEDVIEKITYSSNRHNDAAQMRAYYEFLNVKQYSQIDSENNIIKSEIIDVGAGSRLYKYNISRINLRPIIDIQDIIRTIRIQIDKSKPFIKNIDEKFETWYNNNIEFIDRNQPLLNFTDSIYYINFDDIKEIRHTSYKNGLIGFGTVHVFRQPGELKFFDKIFGAVVDKDKEMEMRVFGNDKAYKHKKTFSDLLEYDAVLVKKINDNLNLMAIAIDHIDFSATVYFRYALVVTPKQPDLVEIKPIKKRLIMVDLEGSKADYIDLPYIYKGEEIILQVDRSTYTEIRSHIARDSQADKDDDESEKPEKRRKRLYAELVLAKITLDPKSLRMMIRYVIDELESEDEF